MRTNYVVSIVTIVILLAVVMFINGKFMRDAQNKDVQLQQQPVTAEVAKTKMSLASTAFEPMGSIPAKYTCDEKSVSVPLTIADAPKGTQSFVVIVEDPDVPKNLKPDGVFLHWVAFNIPDQGLAAQIEEGKLPAGALSGANGTGKPGYVGPCPPKEYQPNEHRYVFTVYALNTMLTAAEGASKDAILTEMNGHVLGTAELVGKYKKR